MDWKPTPEQMRIMNEDDLCRALDALGNIPVERVEKICEAERNGALLSKNYVSGLIAKHGRYAAAKWAGHPDERPYWEARYCGMQTLYRDIADSPSAYSDFNAKCGVTFADGHIAKADGESCVD